MMLRIIRELWVVVWKHGGADAPDSLFKPRIDDVVLFWVLVE
jgi:hypothetical protein